MLDEHTLSRDRNELKMPVNSLTLGSERRIFVQALPPSELSGATIHLPFSWADENTPKHKPITRYETIAPLLQLHIKLALRGDACGRRCRLVGRQMVSEKGQ